MEKSSLTYTAGGNMLKKKYNSKGTIPMEGNLAVCNRKKCIYLLSLQPHNLNNVKIWTHRLFSARLSVIAEHWKLPECPTTGDWLNNCHTWISYIQ